MLVVQFKNKKRDHRVHNSNFGLSWWVAEMKPLIKKKYVLMNLALIFL